MLANKRLGKSKEATHHYDVIMVVLPLLWQRKERPHGNGEATITHKVLAKTSTLQVIWPTVPRDFS